MCTNRADQNPTFNKMDKRIVAVASWIDLLGYGQQISDANFDPRAEEPHKRLWRFRKTVAEYARKRNFQTLVLNDGAVAYRDLTCNSADTLNFVKKSWELYLEVNQIECGPDYRGARMVLASGFRNPGAKAGNEETKRQLRRKLEDVLKDIEDGCTKEEAIERATRVVYPFRPPADILPQLQENFAFSKAYIAEKSGSEGNLPGPKFYVDLNIFKCTNKFEPYVEWSCGRLNLAIDFAKFTMGDGETKEIKICREEVNNKDEISKRLDRSSKRLLNHGFRPVFC